MTAADVPAAARLGGEALAPTTGGPPDAARRAWLEARCAHLRASDPGGAFVAADPADGTLAGVTLAVLREGVWGLSWFAVEPDRQGQGVGRALLDATLAYGAPHRGAIVTSSTDPRAMRRYARAGFALLPCVAASGIPDRRRIPGGLRAREATVDEAVPVAAAAGRAARGAAYARADLALMAAHGMRLFVLGEAGLAIHREDACVLLAAADDATATDLLWTCLAAAPPGGTYGLDFLTAGQDWAIAVALEAGLALTPDGPVLVRGALGPLRPWLPSGALL
jgi:GNAT superfamily N-acetyltransferase